MAIDPSWIAFVDEAGDRGWHFDAGSSQFLVLCAALMPSWFNFSGFFDGLDQERNASGSDTHHTIKANGQLNPLKKFSDAKDWQRHLFFRHLSATPVRYIFVVIDKPCVTSPQFLARPDDLYRYAFKLLLERISWFGKMMVGCQPPDGQSPLIAVKLGEDKSLEYAEFVRYAKKLKYGHFNTSVDWRHIDPSAIDAEPFQVRTGHHFADYGASAISAAIRRREFGLVDDRWLRMLSPNLAQAYAVEQAFKVFPNDSGQEVPPPFRFWANSDPS